MMVAAIFVIFVGQQRMWDDTLGKTDMQILRMGRDSWWALFSEKYGESNSAHSNGLYAYEKAVKRVNDRLLASPRLPHRDQARKLADLVEKFAKTTITLGYSLDPNTGWGPVGNGLEADAEEAIYGYLHPGGRPKPKAVVVSQVRKVLDAQASLVEGGGPTGPFPPGQSRRIKADYAELYKLYREIVPLIAATTGRTGSDRILGFCLKAAETISY